MFITWIKSSWKSKLISTNFSRQSCRVVNFYSTKTNSSDSRSKPHEAFEQLIQQLRDSRQTNGILPAKPLIKLIKLIETNKTIDSTEALELIRSCNPNLIDLFPSDRQKLLDRFFHKLLPQCNYATLDQDHYYSYMVNTCLNKAQFNPFLVSREMNKRGISARNMPAIDSLLIKQLCENKKIPHALVR